LDCLWTIQLALLLAIQWRNVMKKAKKKNREGWWWLQGWVLVTFEHSLIFMVFQSPASVFVLIQWVLFLLACLFYLTSCFLQFNDKMWWGRSVT
jgi:protein-S-isoprenylcysteine O-methyltransferase Ste14